MPGSRFPRGGEVALYNLSCAAMGSARGLKVGRISPRGTGIVEMQVYVILPVFTLRLTHGD